VPCRLSSNGRGVPDGTDQLDDTDAPRLDTVLSCSIYSPTRRSCTARPAHLHQALFAKIYCEAHKTEVYVAEDELSDLVFPLVKEARYESGAAQVGGAASGSGKNPFVEVMTSYLNHTDRAAHARQALLNSGSEPER
jgi:protocatechuate 3,4-dioxygenase beta subunit